MVALDSAKKGASISSIRTDYIRVKGFGAYVCIACCRRSCAPLGIQLTDLG